MSEFTVDAAMSSDVCTVSPDTDIADVVEVMRLNSFSCIVVEEDGKPAGIVTERDIVKLTNLLFNATDIKPLKTKMVMTSPTVVINKNAKVLEAILLCRERKIRHLPVVDDDGDLCGLLTQSDLLESYTKSQEALLEELHKQIRLYSEAATSSMSADIPSSQEQLGKQ